MSRDLEKASTESSNYQFNVINLMWLKKWKIMNYTSSKLSPKRAAPIGRSSDGPTH